MIPCDAKHIQSVGDLHQAMSEFHTDERISLDIEVVARIGGVYLPLDIVTVRSMIVSADRHSKPFLTMVVDAGCFNRTVRLATI
jgi:hypothetical protein